MTKTLKLSALAVATLAVSACSNYATYEQAPYQGRMAGKNVVVATAPAAPAPAVAPARVQSAQPIFKDAMRK